MDTNQAVPCIFCGECTEEQNTTSIGKYYVHANCLADLEEVIAITWEYQEDGEE